MINKNKFFMGVEFLVCKDGQGKDCRPCGAPRTGSPNKWLHVDCPARVGRYVRLVNYIGELKNWHFCRVFVYGNRGALLSEGMPTSSSALSGYGTSGAAVAAGQFPASNGVLPLDEHQIGNTCTYYPSQANEIKDANGKKHLDGPAVMNINIEEGHRSKTGHLSDT